METEITGLTETEVQERKRREQDGAPRRSITKSTGRIVRENVFTLFNLLNFSIAVLLLFARAYSNMLFIAIILFNILINIAQELKAKKLVDELSLLNRPQATALRDGKEKNITAEEIVKDDVIILESGRQICSDATVLSGSLEVNESLLTGESDAVVKESGDSLLSGSFVISGKCYARATHASSESYISKLTDTVKSEKETGSELLASMRKVTRFTSFLILPLGILLFIEAFLLRNAPFDTAAVATAAALLGMLPKGLVLLISVSLANGVIRLSKKKILVQNIYSLETLAHVDVLCLDKTGTLTDGNMEVRSVSCMGASKEEETSGAEELICSYLAASDDNNATIQALKAEFKPELIYTPVEKLPFSSKRKWGAVNFGTVGTVYVGAPEKILGDCPETVVRALDQGYRTLAIGYSKQGWTEGEAPPLDILPLYIVTLADNIRKNVGETLKFFYREGVAVKVISGDHVKTVSMVAKKAGLKHWEKAVDVSILGEDIDYDRICEEYDVFARATPKQKQELIAALKRKGHHVAMTGDGVNDLLALRTADCSIAVAEGSDASRQISQIVLLKSDFTHLPQVVKEGRKVVNNATRTAGVFFIKTIYSFLLSLLCLIGNISFPFIPIQITLIDAAMEAYPSFMTIFESDTRRIQESFLNKVIGNALPFALTATSMMGFVALFLPLPAAQKRTMMYFLLILTTMTAVIKSCVPFTALRAFICVTMVIGTFMALWLFTAVLEITALSPMLLALTALIFGMGLIILFLKTFLISLQTNKKGL